MGCVVFFSINSYAKADDKTWQGYQNNATQQFEAGQYTQAMNNAQQALKLAEKGQGQTSPYIASSLNMMAMIADAQGNTAQAINYMQRAVKLFQQSIGTHENTATLMFNLARFYEKQKQWDQALQILNESDQMVQSLLVKQQTSERLTLQNKILSEIQQVLLQQGKSSQAQQYTQRQYDLITKNSLAAGNPQQNLTVIRSLLILAQSYQQQNQIEKSDQILADIFKRFDPVKTTLKPEQWQTDYADALELKSQNVQQTSQSKEIHLEAIHFYEQLPQASKNKYISRLANHYNELGLIDFEQKKFDESLQWFEKSKALMQQAYGQNSQQYARLLGNFAQVKDNQSEYKPALQYYQQAQNIYEILLKPLMTSTESRSLRQAYAQVLNNSAVIEFKLREYEKAEQQWNKGLSLFSQDSFEQIQQSALPILENLLRLYRTQQRKSDESKVQYQINQMKSWLNSKK